MKLNVLIIDDSGFSRRMLRQILEGAGYEVEEAPGGFEALERYSLKRADVVLLDIIMDGMSGLEVLGRLRELDCGAKVLVATADTQTATRQEAEAAGAMGMIRKPFDKEQVLGAIQAVVAGGVAWN
ncbi:MAG TPA: response regulator [Verrucomicrobiae bacterium]|nr:response regulator [Verrucomicrobiae bacterium]